jgi:squalene-hopene/tetraprenyl-beta-curcumene cyclase
MSPLRATSSAPPADLDVAIRAATDAMLLARKEGGHWCFELEADATIPAEYILLRHFLGEPDDLELEARIGRYLRRIQADHGGWPLFHAGAFDISATVKAYYALKVIGDDPEESPMVAPGKRTSSRASSSRSLARSPGARSPPCPSS